MQIDYNTNINRNNNLDLLTDQEILNFLAENAQDDDDKEDEEKPNKTKKKKKKVKSRK